LIVIPEPGTILLNRRSGPDIPLKTCPTVDPVYPRLIPTEDEPPPEPPVTVGPVIVITSEPVEIMIPFAPVKVLKISESPDIPP
jgi:hypothetical protein